MLASMVHDAHARPPEYIRELFKQWRKRPAAGIEDDQHIIDPRNPDVTSVSALPEPEILSQSDFDILLTNCVDSASGDLTPGFREVTLPPRTAFEVNGLPGSLTLVSVISRRS